MVCIMSSCGCFRFGRSRSNLARYSNEKEPRPMLSLDYSSCSSSRLCELHPLPSLLSTHSIAPNNSTRLLPLGRARQILVSILSNKDIILDPDTSNRIVRGQ